MTDATRIRAPLAHYPGINRFVLDWMAGESAATRLLPRHADAAPRPAPSGTRRSDELVAAIDRSNRRWGIFAGDQIRRWGKGETVTLVAGQQVGFAGGPLYTLAKIASLVRMKRDLEAEGVAATAFFWLATEDHDYDEVAQLSVPQSTIRRDAVNRQLDLISIRASRSFESKSVVGPLPVPDVLVTELTALYDIERPAWLRAGITFGDSFAELIASVFGSEVILVDALLPELRRSGADLFQRLNDQWAAVQAALSARGAELEAAGYRPQVAPRDDGAFTLFFEIDERGDRRIIDTPRAVEPERVSTSALTRPLLQDEVLRPDVFIGGPAEVAYYAQLAPLHEMLSIPRPRVALRGHVLVAPKRVIRFVSRYAIGPEEMFAPPDELLASREPEAAAEVRRLTEAGQRELIARIERIAELAMPAEHAIARAVSRSIGHIEYHFDKLTERAIKAIVRKDRDRWTAARELAATLHPDGKVQDRVVAWYPFWCQHRSHLIDRFIEEVEPDSDSFKVIAL